MSKNMSYKNQAGGISGNYFGRICTKDVSYSSDTYNFDRVYEVMVNKTGSDDDALAGKPLIRGLANAHWAYFNTSGNGSFMNNAGVGNVAFKNRLNNRYMILLRSLTTAPVAGDTLTQATSLATMVVESASTTLNYVIGTVTGTWDWANNYAVTSDDAGTAVFAPATARLQSAIIQWDTVSYGDMPAVSSSDALILVGIRGYFYTLFGSDAGLANSNGVIAAGDPFTYNNDAVFFVEANYHDLIDNEAANGDNIYGFSMEAIIDDDTDLAKFAKGYHCHDEPKVFGGTDQGVYEAPQA